MAAISERAAAKKLGMVQETLRYHRNHGWVRPDIFLHVDQPPQKAQIIIRYDSEMLDAIVEGEQSLYADKPA